MPEVKVITPGDGRSLNDLDLKKGDFVGFYKQDVERPKPFLIAMVGEKTLRQGNFSKDPNDFTLQHYPNPKKEAQDWILNTEGGGIELHFPEPHSLFHLLNIAKHTNTNQPYNVEYAYVGEEEIIKGLRNTKNLEFYAGWFEREIERIRAGR